MTRTRPPVICLASASPRRAELLQQLDIPFQQISVAVEEVRQQPETPEQYARRVAADKARAGWACPERQPHLPVLGADTDVVVDDRILGKPADDSAAREMLSLLSGRCHQVISAVALCVDGQTRVRVSRSEVAFRRIRPEEVDWYIGTGEPRGKAGAYGIQGKGAAFVRHIIGSYTGIVGLPLFETLELLRDHQVEFPVTGKIITDGAPCAKKS